MKLHAQIWDKVQYIFRNYYDRMIHFAGYYNGEIDLALLRKSLFYIVEKYPVLRSSFEHSSINPHWKVNEDFCEEEMAERIVCDDLVKSVHTSLAEEISADSKFQFKLTAHYCDGKTAVSLIVNHMCMDGTDFKYFISKIVEGYNILLDGGDISTLSLKTGERGAEQIYKNMSEEDAEKAKGLYKNVSRTGIKNRFAFTKDTDCTTCFNLRKLSSDTVQSLKRKGKEYGATLNDVFIAAYARAISSRLAETDDERIVVTSMKNLRDHIEGGESEDMTNLTGFMPCVLDRVEGDFSDTLKTVAEKNRQSKEDKFCGLYGLPLMALAFKVFPFSIAELAIKIGYENPLIGMSNIGIISEEGVTFGGCECVDAFVTGATKFKPYIQLTATTFKGETTLCIAQKCSDEDRRRINELLDEIVSILKEFCNNR